MNAERIYVPLEQDPKYRKVKQLGEGLRPDPMELTPEELEKAERQWRRVVRLAADRAEHAGTLQGQLKIMINAVWIRW